MRLNEGNPLFQFATRTKLVLSRLAGYCPHSFSYAFPLTFTSSSTLPSEPFFCFLDFDPLEKDSTSIKYELCWACVACLLGYSFEPRPNSRALCTASSDMHDHQFINNRCSYSKNQFDKRKQDWLVQNSGCSEFKGLTRCRQRFLSPSPDQREDKKGFVCRVFVLVHKYTKKGLPQYSKSWSHATVKNTYRGSTEAVTLYT